jgi:hypothetical protein
MYTTSGHVQVVMYNKRPINDRYGFDLMSSRSAFMCALNGIVHQKTVPYSPQQNGVAERMNRTIMEKARSMLYYKGI